MYTACFTGHRTLNGRYDGEEWKKLSGYMSNVLIPKVCKEYKITNFISGMALGVDMLAAELVLYHKNRLKRPLTLEAAIPYENQYKIWSEKEQRRYHTILKQCDSVKVLFGEYHENWKLQKRNEYMVDKSNYVIAIWDGFKKGGTYNCYAYATKNKKNVIIVNPLTLQWDAENQLLPI
jgi:uncharacterized phage-like protein YoqJ